MSNDCPDPVIAFDRKKRTKTAENDYISSEEISCVQFFNDKSISLFRLMELQSCLFCRLAKTFEFWHTFGASVIKKIGVLYHLFIEIYASVAAKKVGGLRKKTPLQTK